ncbi:MAG TPA: hypothetical protein PKE20_08350 [Promineifilum sp.]|nr:hypothetical protein [Promineifilum sp.]
MPEAHYQPGQSFNLQFAWRLPEGDYLRALFQADVLEMVPGADKYVVRLSRFLAGREDEADGQVRQLTALEGEYWDLVRSLVGRTITIAYEADDGNPIYLRLATLTGEHNFFTRYEDAAVIARGIEARLRRLSEEKTAEE